MAYGVQGADLAGSFGSLWNDLQGIMGAGHAHCQQIPQDVQQLLQKAEQALAQGNDQQAARYLQQAAQAAGNNTPLGQELSQAAQALQQSAQQQAAGAGQPPGQADGSGQYGQSCGQSGQVPGSGQCGQNEGSGQESGLSSQDLNQLLSVALNLISKGDSSDAKHLIRYVLQHLSAQYPSYSTGDAIPPTADFGV